MEPVLRSIISRFPAPIKRTFCRPLFWLLVFLMIVPASMSLTGRYSSLPHNDLVQDTMNAWNLVHHGEFPKHSGISTYFGMIPPGISYAFVPGELVFPGNPTAAERLGAALMFAGTLIGLYLWLGKRLGTWPTALAMIVFTVGRSGLFYAYSLWPRGHVFFVVWFLYFLTLWVERRQSRWLGASLVVFIASTYWFMELVPVFIVLPVLYFLYKPPLGWRSLMMAAFLGFLIWLPYLAFEYPRDFIDLRALVTQKVLVKPYSIGDVVTDKSHYIVNSWEVPNLKAQAAEHGGHLARQNGLWLKTSAWGTVWAETETRYYLNEPGFVFYHPGFNEWCFQSFASGRILRPNHTAWEPGRYPVDFPKELMHLPPNTTGAGAAPHDFRHFAPFYNLASGRSDGIFLWHIALFLFATGFVAWRGYGKGEISGACRAWKGICLRANSRPSMPAADNARLVWTVIATALILPLVIQCVLVKSWDGLFTSERRFVWLWLAEAVAIGAALGSIEWRGKRIGLALGAAAIVTLSLNPNMSRIASEAYSSLPGRYRSDEDKALDSLAALVKAEGRTSARIGYDLNQNQWMFFVRPIDGVSKCAIDWDVALLLRHGIANLDTTPEGLSADDEFRVYDPNYDVPHESYWRSRWSVTFDGSFPPMETAAEVDRYQILRPAKNTVAGKN